MNCSDSLFYVVFENINASWYIGVKKKILGQLEAFSKKFSSCYLTYYSYGIVYLLKDGMQLEKNIALSLDRCYSIYLKWFKKYRCKWMYARTSTPVTYGYLDFLSECKEMGLRVVLEFPTYPYDEIISKDVLLEDKENRLTLNKFVDRVATYADYKNIFNIPSFIIQNGISDNDIPVRCPHHKSSSIELLAVANLNKGDGYERVIEGINIYYQKGGTYNFHFNIIGDGLEKNNYIKTIKEYGLEKSIQCCGIKRGKELDWYYDNADIGISPFGLYKYNSGEIASGPIKTREYCARGLPFVFGYNEMGFSGDEIYTEKFSNSSEPVDMNRVVELYERTVDRQDVIDMMKQKVKKNFTWDTIMNDIINFYKTN